MHKNTQTSRILQTGHFLGLKFGDNGWWFVHVLETEYDELKPWILQNESGNRAAIASQTAGSEDDVKDSNGRNYIVPDDDQKNLIFQTMFGIAPSRMQLFFKFGRDFPKHLQTDDQPGDTAPITNGFDSPYNNPNRSEAEIITINDIDTPSLQAYNPMDEAEDARLSVHINKIKYATVTEVQLMNSFLQGHIPARLRPAGLAVESSDQAKAPSWLTDNFGEHIKTTQEIFEEAEEQEEDTTPQIPTSGGGIETQ